MNWNNLHEATAQNEKPAPGWLFQEICQDAMQHPQDVPDAAEYLMRCVACDSKTVCMKACLAIRHLADEVPHFRQYMQRCPDALALLQEIAEPPQLAQARSLERPEAKVAREAALRALRSCVSEVSAAEQMQKQQLKSRIQAFGNYMPPEDEAPQTQGARGLVDKVAGFVGDAVADTVDDFREKGAVGAVRDGVADAADLILDGVGAFWEFLGGRKNKAAQPAEDRICRPYDEGLAYTTGCAPGGGAFAGVPAPASAPGYQGAFGRGAVGAGHAFHPALFQQDPSVAAYGLGAPAAVPTLPKTTAPEPAAPAAPAELEDLLSFEDEPSDTPMRPGDTCADLLSFGDDASGVPAATGPTGSSLATSLKNKGNELVRAKKHTEAAKAYEAALASLEGEPEEATTTLRATLFANLAMCHLQQQLYRRAIEAATLSIQCDAGHAKAYYRRCLAYKGLKLYAEAKGDFDALQLCKHEMTQAEMRRLQAALAGNS